MVAEATGSREGVGNEAEVVEEDKGRTTSGLLEVELDGGDEVGVRKAEGMGQLGVEVGSSIREEDVPEDRRIDGWARELGEGNKGAIVLVATPPEVDSSSVPMVAYEQIVTQVDGREGIVVGVGQDEAGACREERQVEAEEVLEGWFDP
jgi:hypothetical protein